MSSWIKLTKYSQKNKNWLYKELMPSQFIGTSSIIIPRMGKINILLFGKMNI
jgi:hypothetical protein